MTQIGDRLFGEFAACLNEELTALKSRLRVATSAPEEAGSMTLLSATGAPLGILPDDISATAIISFERILDQVISAKSVG